MDWSTIIGLLLFALFFVIPIIRKIGADIKKVGHEEERKAERNRKDPALQTYKKGKKPPKTVPYQPKESWKEDFQSDLDSIPDPSHLSLHHLETHFSSSADQLNQNGMPTSHRWEKIEKKAFRKKLILYKEIMDLPKFF